jgi:hypothetical protein
VRVEVSILHPATLSIRIGGTQSIEAQGVPAIPFTAARAVIAADLTGAAPIEASVGGLVAMLPSGNATLDRADVTLPPDAVATEVSGLSLPGLAAAIGTLRVRAAIAPLPPAAESAQASARAWRGAGGHIDITDAALQWDTLDATGSGRITLDDRLQPQAEGTVEVRGLPRLLDDLAKAGTLAPAQAGAAKAVLSILAAPTGGERVQLPISLADGVLRLARFPLARFPPLAWE